MSRSYESLLSYTGERHRDDLQIQDICNRIDELKCRDLTSIAIAVSKERADRITANDVLGGSSLHEASGVDQRIFHAIDSLLYDSFSEVPFVELSPVQPFGLNTALANLSESKILAATRRSEVNADISTSLVREAVMRNPDLLGGNQRLASSTRITRTQKFDPTSKFLPHFRMFGQVTVGRDEDGRSQDYHLTNHLASELEFLQKFKGLGISRLDNFSIELGDVRIMDKLITSGRVDLGAIKRNTTNPSYNVFEASGLNLSRLIDPQDPNLAQLLEELDLKDVYTGILDIHRSLSGLGHSVKPNCLVRLDRFAGHNYYQGACYNIFGTNDTGVVLPLADGGYTDWVKKLTGNRKSFGVSSGIGTELLARHFTTQSN